MTFMTIKIKQVPGELCSSVLRFTVLGVFPGDDSTSENPADRSSGGAGTDVYTEDKGGRSCDPDRETTGGA